MKLPNQIISKRDFIIPKGTIFRNIDGRTDKHCSGNYETLISIGKDNTGFFCVEIDNEYFKGLEEG